MVIFFACFTRKADDDVETTEYLDDNATFDLTHNEEYLPPTTKVSFFLSQTAYYNSFFVQKKLLYIYRPLIRADRLSEGEVAYARYQREKQLHMWSILREFSLYFAYISILLVIVYSNNHSNAFLQVDHLRNNLLRTNINYMEVDNHIRIFRNNEICL